MISKRIIKKIIIGEFKNNYSKYFQLIFKCLLVVNHFLK